jgi:hypothetical protein
LNHTPSSFIRLLGDLLFREIKVVGMLSADGATVGGKAKKKGEEGEISATVASSTAKQPHQA